MSLLPITIIKPAMLRIGAYKGVPSEILANYANDAFTDFQSESFVTPDMHSMLTSIEQQMSLAVAMNQNNTLRSNIKDTVAVTSGDEIPSFGSSASTAKIIGEWGQVREAGSGKLLVPALREEEIRIMVDNPGGIFKTSYFGYALRPPRIYATVESLEIDCCVFDYDARKAAIEANEALLFPMAQAAYFDGLMSTLKNEDTTLTELSDKFEKPYAEWLGAQQANRPVTREASA